MTHPLTLRAMILAALACAVSATAAPAFAQSDNHEPSITVQLSDINVNSPKGAKVALHRITNAADYLCNSQPTAAFERGEGVAYDLCMKETIKNAAANVNSPTLTALLTTRPSTMASK